MNMQRRKFITSTVVGLAGVGLTGRADRRLLGAPAAEPGTIPTGASARPFLTSAPDFQDVSRGNPNPQTLQGEALINARLTPETWRLEVAADDEPKDYVKEQATITQPLTLDLAALQALGKAHGVKFIKAMQCLNIPTPLGQGLWEGVPLREVLRLSGRMTNVRRIFYWGFHNNDPAQIFRSSLSYSQVMETPPGELPVFVAYKLNGEPLPLERGGPVRMIVPWAHGFKSIKWLQRIMLTNDYKANDTYAEKNNDPESHLKTAAYLDEMPKQFAAGEAVPISGLAISGWSGLRRVEYWVRAADSPPAPLPDEDPAWESAKWQEGILAAPPRDWAGILPAGVSAKEVLGFDTASGQPLSWPLRYSMVGWSAAIPVLPPGQYEVRARAVDLNGFAQPEPRPIQKAGKNGIQVRRFEVV
jgi:DMSO/TMAO reductase YedYZ molybdopterin-dependent catalytic subunit